MTFKGWTLHDLKAHKPSQLLNIRSPLRLLIIITSMVFLSEATVMLLIALLPPFPSSVVALLDSLLLVTATLDFSGSLCKNNTGKNQKGGE